MLLKLETVQLFQLLTLFESQLDHARLEYQQKKRHNWSRLEQTLAVPFTILDSDGDLKIEWSDLPEQLQLQYPEARKFTIQEFENWITTLEQEGNPWAFSYRQSRQWVKFITSQRLTEANAKRRVSFSLSPQKLSQRLIPSIPPTLIISYGPPGSGKSTIIPYYLKNLHSHRPIYPVSVNIDDLTRDYMKQIMKHEEWFSDSEIYFRVRSKWPLLARDTIIHKCLHQRYSFIIETTGKGTSAADTIIPLASKNGYQIVLVYVLVPFLELLARLIHRETLTGQGHPPFDHLMKSVIQSAKNVTYYREKILKHSTILQTFSCQRDNHPIRLIDNSQSTSNIPSLITTKKRLKSYLAQPGILPECVETLKKFSFK